MPSAATISLLIPCYNEGNYIAKTIEQAKKQSHSFNEIICYDDCSSDDTVKILKSLDIKVIQGRENKGPGHARNQLIDQCTTDYFHFHDADDPFLSKDFIKELLVHADKSTAVFCDWVRISEDSSETANQYANLIKNSQAQDLWIKRHLHLNAIIFPTQWVKNNLQFDESFITQQDILFNLQAAQRGLEYHYLPKLLATHVRNPSSHTAKHNSLKFHETHIRIILKALEHNNNEFTQKILSQKMYYHFRELISLGEHDLFKKHQTLLETLPKPEAKTGKIESLIKSLFTPFWSLYYYSLRSKKRDS